MKMIAVAIIVKNGEVLMVRRRAKEGSLQWQFPSGGVEDGETTEQAAVREAQEETGVTCKVVRSLGSRVHPNTGREIHYLECAYLSGNAHVADSEELDTVVWAQPKAVYELITSDIFVGVRELLDGLAPR